MLSNPNIAEKCLIELDQLESRTAAIRGTLIGMEKRIDHLYQELDAFTAPLSIKTMGFNNLQRGVFYKGEFVTCRYLIDIHLTVMKKLFIDYPDMRDDMARAVSSAGLYRKYIAKDSSKLYDFRRLERFARPLVNGWFIDTNITSPERIERILTLALQAVGLEWGKDVIVQWNARMEG